MERKRIIRAIQKLKKCKEGKGGKGRHRDERYRETETGREVERTIRKGHGCLL